MVGKTFALIFVDAEMIANGETGEDKCTDDGVECNDICCTHFI